MVIRLLKAKHICRKEEEIQLPKDLFRLKDLCVPNGQTAFTATT